MTTPDQMRLREHIFLAAIWESFHAHEKVLSLHQLLLRKVTPLESMSRTYIGHLLGAGMIKISDSPRGPGVYLNIKGGKSYVTAIRESSEWAPSYPWKGLSLNDRGMQTIFLELIFELSAATLIAYVKYFSEKEDLDVEELDYKSSSLRIFFENLSLSQTFMLFWRAIKSSAETQRSIKFTQVVNLAYQYFEHYCASGKEIKPYPRPRTIKQSRLEKIIFCDVLKISGDPDLLPNIHEYLTGPLECQSPAERDSDLSYFDVPFEDK